MTDSAGAVVQTAPTFHSLRHSHASALIADGWDVAEVSARLGHANVATTHRITCMSTTPRDAGPSAGRGCRG